MYLEPLMTANLMIKAHVALATSGVLIGGAQLLLKKGTKNHKVFGWAWVLIMALVGVSAIFLPDRRQTIVPITWLLTLWVAIGLPLAIRAIKKGDIMLHRAFMIGLYIGGLFIALAFTITPGRLLYKVFFGQFPH